MKRLTFLVITILITCFSTQASITEHKKSVYFNTAKAQLTTLGKAQLNELIAKAGTFSDFELYIVGHTDNRGSNHYNEQLSLQRSEVVKLYLTQKGIDLKRVSIDFKGELAPVLPNTTSQNMESNRRVEVYLKGYNFENVTELEQALRSNNQTITSINPAISNLIKGNHGVQIYLPKGAFVDTAGNTIEEEVTVTLIESLNLKDFIASGLQTKADRELLETGGMIKITATTKTGKPLQLAENANLIVAIPNDDREIGMEVFLSDSGANWNATGQPINNRLQISKLKPFPVLHADKTPFPPFKYNIAQPKEPKGPVKIRKPHEPKVTSYVRKIPWYRFHKAELQAKQQNNYHRALEHYNNRVELYDARFKKYQFTLAEFKEAYQQYNQEMEQWTANKNEAQENFRQTPEYLAVLQKRRFKDKKHKAIFDKAVVQWRAERKRKVAEWGESMDMMGISSENDLKNYIFTVSDLKWINVDKFMKLPAEEKQMALINSTDIANEKVHIVFKNSKTLITCNPIPEYNRFEAHNLPKKIEAYIFAYKVVDCKPMMCYLQMNGNENYELQFMESSFVEIKAVLNQLEG